MAQETVCYTVCTKLRFGLEFGKVMVRVGVRNSRFRVRIYLEFWMRLGLAKGSVVIGWCYA